MAVTFFNWIKTTLANITAANIADADEFVVIDQDGDGASPPGPASKAITRAELSKSLVVQEELAESPISPDNTVAEYVFDVTDYEEVELQLDNVGFASSDIAIVRFSNDDGSTYKAGASDYERVFIDSGTPTLGATNNLTAGTQTSATGHYGNAKYSNLRAGRGRLRGEFWNAVGSTARVHSGFANFAGPITHIKILANSGNNFNAGTIRVVGIRGSAP